MKVSVESNPTKRTFGDLPVRTLFKLANNRVYVKSDSANSQGNAIELPGIAIALIPPGDTVLPYQEKDGFTSFNITEI